MGDFIQFYLRNGEPTNQPTNQPTNLPTNQPTNRPYKARSFLSNARASSSRRLFSSRFRCKSSSRRRMSWMQIETQPNEMPGWVWKKKGPEVESGAGGFSDFFSGKIVTSFGSYLFGYDCRDRSPPKKKNGCGF